VVPVGQPDQAVRATTVNGKTLRWMVNGVVISAKETIVLTVDDGMTIKAVYKSFWPFLQHRTADPTNLGQ
jgi:hypothetical protein